MDKAPCSDRSASLAIRIFPEGLRSLYESSAARESTGGLIASYNAHVLSTCRDEAMPRTLDIDKGDYVALRYISAFEKFIPRLEKI
jgi:hypothetical protein